MYKIYFKQALKMLKQNKFISIVSILGTAIAIMMIMAIVVSDEIKNASIAPEINRHRTYYINLEAKKDTARGSMSAGNLSYEIVRDYLSELKVPERTSIYNRSRGIVGITGFQNEKAYPIKYTDDAFWWIISFSFIEGRTFNKEEYESGVHYAVISESLAKETFKGENAIGKEIDVNFKTYKVIGVVEDVPPLFTHAYSDVWVPYTTSPTFPKTSCTMMLTLKNKKEYPALYTEIRNIEKKYNSNNVPKTVFLKGPESQQVYNLHINNKYSLKRVEKEIQIMNRKKIFILVILLLVPAINLSGFSLSRIKKRMSEIGVRKAFGAKKHIILIQVLYENLITSLIGGVLGLIFSYFIVLGMREWLLRIPADSNIPLASLVSPWVFLSVFLACLLLNLLSCGIPAYRASRMSIIHSLNQNDH